MTAADADLTAIRALEERTLATSPAIHERAYDGWVLRASQTDTRRANSITMLHVSNLPLDEKIAFCEAWYQRHGQPPIFRLTEAFAPPDLEPALHARGYVREGETSVMTAPNGLGVSDAATAAFATEPPAGTRLVKRTTAEAIADLHRMKGSDATMTAQDTLRQELWCGEETYLALKTINGVVAVGLARIEDGMVGIFNMRTADTQRGKGYASALVAALLAWGREQGARTAFLQVDCVNLPALSVYRRFGFVEQYRYWYRVGPKQPR
jgi:N-acetylglutamate synthase